MERYLQALTRQIHKVLILWFLTLHGIPGMKLTKSMHDIWHVSLREKNMAAARAFTP